jgi:hypothetical protein
MDISRIMNPSIPTLVALLATSSVFAQGTFRNLGFEESIPPVEPGGFPNLIGWQVFEGGFGYNTISLGGESVILHDGNSPYLTPLIGNFSVVLVNGAQPPIGDGGIAEIAQTGTIPANSLSLRFVATSLSPVVTFGGTPIGLSIVNSTATYNVFAGDITSLAGQTGELRFSQTGMFDVVTFSTLPVPESGTAFLLVVGAALLGAATRRRH